jgi:hypothetical protein
MPHHFCYAAFKSAVVRLTGEEERKHRETTSECES